MGVEREKMKKVSVITGGALGIGKALVEAFAKRGDLVVFIDLQEEALIKTEQEMQEKGYCVKGYVGDISKEEVLTRFAKQVVEEYGQVDVLINNACISKGGILTGCSYEEFNDVLKVGVMAPYLLTLLFKNHFAKGASIVNITSTRAVMSQANTESYTAAKGAISSLTHALAVSLSGKVRVNSIAPGWIDTWESHGEEEPVYSTGDLNQHPSKRVGVPEDVARVALFLCDTDNSFLNGENITVDGGMTKQMVYHNDHGWFYREES